MRFWRKLSTFPSAAALLVLGLVGELRATTVDFEGFPDSTTLTTQYPGLTFTNAIILTSGIGLNELEFPPHTGVNVVSDNSGPITIDFADPITSFSAYFTYLVPLTVSGFDTTSNQVVSTPSAFSNNLACLAGPPCAGDPGSNPNELLQVSFAAGMSSVTITGDPLGGSFTMDDATYTSVPEPGPFALTMVGVAVLVTANVRKKRQ